MPPFFKSLSTPCPSGITCVAQAQVSQSVIINIFRFSPVAVGQTSPVNVCIRTGTRVSHAATIHIIPALGVIECTTCGFSLRNTLIILISDFKSFTIEICLSIGTATQWNPSLSLSSSSSGPGDVTATMSYPIARIFIITSRQKPKDCGTVTARIILFLLRFIIIEIKFIEETIPLRVDTPYRNTYLKSLFYV